MNRIAYLTTELAISAVSRLIKAKAQFHNTQEIPSGPIIFAANHFTRLETLLLPYYLYQLTKKQIWSLAAADLFVGGLKSYFEMMGVVSTRDPQRDQLIINTLLSDQAHWIIFPEGRMVKDKKLVDGKRFVVGSGADARAPHTGAAVLALRAEILRRFAGRHEDKSETPPPVAQHLQSDETLSSQSVKIVPINLTYYPIRTRDNALSALVSRYVKEPSERMREELMTEGTMLLSGVDIDIDIGKPIDMANQLDHPILQSVLAAPFAPAFDEDPPVRAVLQAKAKDIMHTCMARIYAMTTLNHDHLFATFLKNSHSHHLTRYDLALRVFWAAEQVRGNDGVVKNLHHNLHKSQIHLLTDDRYGKGSRFFQTVLDSGCITETDGVIHKEPSLWQPDFSYHEMRSRNPALVMANEIEPLHALRRCLRRIAYTPSWLLRLLIARYLYYYELKLLHQERAAYETEPAISLQAARPRLRFGGPRRVGVLLIHSYLATPEEMVDCARTLSKAGIWSYCIRLPGHGVSPHALAATTWHQWREAVERGIVLLTMVCRQLFLVGFSASGVLALEVAAALSRPAAGVVAICPPAELAHYSPRFMPPQPRWHQILTRWRKNSQNYEFVEFEPENSTINFYQNPVASVTQVEQLLAAGKSSQPEVDIPVLVMGTEEDQVIDPNGARQIFARIGSSDKEFFMAGGTRHSIMYGPDSARSCQVIASFITDRARA
jgi:esterase/lipase/1-acyl-sn-glycerol-3-phosphate acyltransferase